MPLAGGDADGVRLAPPDRVETAIVNAIRSKLGADTIVTLRRLRFSLAPALDAHAVMAVPEPGSKVGGSMRFLLYRRIDSTDVVRPSARLGRADAEVTVSAPHLRMRRAVGRGDLLEADDVELVHGEVGRTSLARLPLAPAVVGGRAVRDLGAGELVTTSVVTSPLLVLSGDDVVVHAAIGPVRATGRAVAGQSGGLGDVIRIVNPDSRRSLRGRVVGKREVEVLHER